MKTVIFEDSPDETFNIMAEDDRFMVCSRIYTVQESKKEYDTYEKKKNQYLMDCFDEQDEYVDQDEYEWSDEYVQAEQDFRYEYGEAPVEYEEDTQCYTIVDLKEKIRGADNYYTRFNYLDKDECKEALKLLNSGQNPYVHGDFQIGRNKVPLGEYTISNE